MTAKTRASETAKKCEAVAKVNRREKIVYCEIADAELIDAAVRDAGFMSFTSWAHDTLMKQAKNQLGLYNIHDYDNHMAKIGTATRPQLEAHQRETRSRNRAWSFLDGKRVVIQ